MTRAVVFAYHNVGVACLRALVEAGVEVPLVLTHEDSPTETIWFDSVADTASRYGIASMKPVDPNTDDVFRRVEACQPDFLFSFYYRSILKAHLLRLPPRGALNMHGSLLPRYRGRVPVNWAIIHGETETGATLHYMSEKPDSGDIVAQRSVPILADDTAKDVFDKVTLAAERVLRETLPSLLSGTAPRIEQDLAAGSCYGGRRPEDGRIDWSLSATAIHNLVRAVAPPYPGAFFAFSDGTARVLRTRVLDADAPGVSTPSMTLHNGGIVARCGGGGSLAILALEISGVPMPADVFAAAYGTIALPAQQRPAM